MSQDKEWAEAFRAMLYKVLRPDAAYSDSATALRGIVKSGLLSHTDLHDNPERFFLAHRILAECGLILGPGHWIRFTVHYNLCYGTVLAVGDKEQVASLPRLQKEGRLGCFGLTERFAGVNSGLVVEVTATYDPAHEQFIINSPDEGACKNWISQGLTADNMVVLCDLVVEGQSYGPHAFLVEMRDQHNKLAEGITVGDMGPKTIGNDLDNAWIKFDKFRVPRSTLLSRYASVSKDGKYSKKADQPLSNMEMIGQRLFTGRVAVAQAAMGFIMRLMAQTKTYTSQKLCWAPRNARIALSEIPQLKALFAEADAKLPRLDRFVDKCEEHLCKVLRKDEIPTESLQKAIAVAKIICVETAIDLCHRLKQEVGSYALMESSGFAGIDFLTCCKFAEGDSRILLLKLARDALRAATSPSVLAAMAPKESKLCEQIGRAVMRDGHKGWNREWEAVYALGWAVVERTLDEWVPSESVRLAKL
eukprot:gb/GEZN01005960.1/.p1 GENE.gb/GEZN01005960.1/~~gb/GEZN01005960.1/.p1  ORF type:complete len:491 (+),score=75.29 gb/GEZN01005960.1/:48-1475(+)